MKKASHNHLYTTSDWDTICFPVESVPVATVLPDSYIMMPSDRQRLIVGNQTDGQQRIFAVQSAGYSLVPNSTLQEAITEVLGADQPVHIRYSTSGEFAINVIFPDQLLVGRNDIIHRQLTFTNSYTGKSQFTIQGTEMKRVRQQKVRIAFYRQICTNGMMGWADEFYSLDEYLNWLITGKQGDGVNVKGLEWVTEQEETLNDVQHIFTHRGIDLKKFRSFLVRFLRSFSGYARQAPSPTLDAFRILQETPVTDLGEAAELIQQAGIPKKLVSAALGRMQLEERLLDSSANAWLLYNGVNHALFNETTGLTIPTRYQYDEWAFHAIASHYLL
jgi:hypothetical protein